MFEDNKVLFYLTDKCLQVVGNNVNGTLDFPEGLVKNQEVTDEEKFAQEIAKFIENQKLQKQKGFILLSDNLVFHRSISITDKEKAEEEYKNFINEIPFKNISKIKYFDNNILIAVAAGKSLFLSVKKSLEELGWEITRVVPAVIFGDLINVKDLKFEDMKQIIESKAFKEVDFLRADTDEEVEKKPEEKKSLYWIFILIILIALLFIALYYFNANKKQTTSPLTQPSPSPNPISTEKPTVSRSDLKIKVLNGSGVAGQAGKIQAQLIALGYRNVETGNLGNEEVGSSTLSVNEKVTTLITEEIDTELKKILSSVTKEATNSSDFDVVIITRK